MDQTKRVLVYICYQSNINQHNLLQVKRILAKLEFFGIENCKQTDTTFFEINWRTEVNIQVCKFNIERTSLLLFLYSRLPPDNIRPGYGPLKEVYICWGPPFYSQIDWFTWKNYWVIITFIFKYKYTCFFLTFSNTRCIKALQWREIVTTLSRKACC